ncbi:MAG TPA: tetratricopeptide repeat protein [Chloroflexia bacterium]|nr:tetratricopeptide repeat protein [Chloroflexia bacterium]
MNVLNSRMTLMVGVALLLVAGSMLFFPAAVRTGAPPAPLAAPADIVGTGVTTGGYADRVISSMQLRLQTNAADAAALAQLGLAYLQKARETNDPRFYTQGEESFQKALAAEPANFDATAGMGSLELSRHQFREALDWGLKARALNPQKAYAYGVIADAYNELGEYDHAVDTLDRMIHLRPDLSSYSRVSYERELHGDVDGAIMSMQQAIVAGGPAPENAAWSRVQLGNLYFNSGQLPGAEKAYNEALAAYPGYLHAQAGLAQVRAAQGELPAAIELYKQAIAVVPLPQYVTALGDLYAAAGDHANAHKQYDLVQYTFQVFEANGVDSSIEKAAFLADQDKDAAEAVRLADAAAAYRADIHTLDTQAWALYRAGRYADALAAEQRALRLGTKNALFYFHLGMIEQQLGDVAGAREHLQQALDLNPNFSIRYAPQAQALLHP